MNHKLSLYTLLLVVLGALVLPACTKDLERKPFYEETTASVYADFANYKHVLAKIYAGLATSGQQGPAGKPDINDIDEGFSSYLRTYWCLQVLTTDEAVIGWNDATLQDLHRMNWTANDAFVKAFYYRIFYQITLTNEFIRELSDEKLAARGISGTDLQEAQYYRAEARFMRALSYWHALDLFGSVPFVTETDPIGTYFPPQASEQQVFDYVESELLAIEGALKAPRQNEYARADQAAAWTLLAKLYLNAEVYIGQAKYTEALTYLNKVLAAGYTLEPKYGSLFMADNHRAQGVIFSVAFDGIRTKTFGGTTFLVHGGIGGSMTPQDYGVGGGWSGMRTTKNLVNLFPDPDGSADKRGRFWSDGQSLEIDDITNFQHGYPLIKWSNMTSGGVAGSDPGGEFVDTDYPLFRLGDVYLMYAEAVLRGGTGGSRAQALALVNELRQRAYDGEPGGAVSDAQLTLDFLLDERARELAWEAQRRTDLVRYGRFTSANYLWPWKGGVRDGRGVEDFRRRFPIPASDLLANPNLTPTTGY